MANQEHADILAKGVDTWNQWRRDLGRATDIIQMPDLSGAALVGFNLKDANLRWANFSSANLSGAHLGSAHCFAADFEGADLSDADLSYSDLTSATVSRGNLTRVNLRSTTLIGTVLRNANLFEARLYDTILGNTDLTGAQGLDTCIHWGPSVIDQRTLARSGQVPIAFLHGCGLPDELMAYLPSLLAQPIQFYSCFISYSTTDQDFADRLYADLQAKGVRCWFAPHDFMGGRKVHEQIAEAIRSYDKLLLILSDTSMNSNWVKTEIANARAREVQQKRQMLFPISIVPFARIKTWKLFDADSGSDSAQEIREYYIPDFSDMITTRIRRRSSGYCAI